MCGYRVAFIFTSSAEAMASLGGRRDNTCTHTHTCACTHTHSGAHPQMYTHTRPRTTRMTTVLGIFSQANNLAQATTSQLLSDDAFLDDWTKTLRSRLRTSWDSAAACLEEEGIPVAGKPIAGHFGMVDLRGLMKEGGGEREAELAARLYEVGVGLTPGKPCGMSEPGWFRLCHAAQSGPAVKEAVRRVGSLGRSFRS